MGTDTHNAPEVAIKEAAWTVLMQLISEHLYGMDCVVVQQIIEAKLGRNRCKTVLGL